MPVAVGVGVPVAVAVGVGVGVPVAVGVGVTVPVAVGVEVSRTTAGVFVGSTPTPMLLLRGVFVGVGVGVAVPAGSIPTPTPTPLSLSLSGVFVGVGVGLPGCGCGGGGGCCSSGNWLARGLNRLSASGMRLGLGVRVDATRLTASIGSGAAAHDGVSGLLLETCASATGNATASNAPNTSRTKERLMRGGGNKHKP